jgi:hypothetical protein
MRVPFRVAEYRLEWNPSVVHVKGHAWRAPSGLLALDERFQIQQLLRQRLVANCSRNGIWRLLAMLVDPHAQNFDVIFVKLTFFENQMLCILNHNEFFVRAFDAPKR